MPQGGATSRSKLREVLVEVRGDRSEDSFVPGLLFLAQLADQLLQVGAGRGDVVELRAQRLEALLELLAFGAGQGVRGPDLLEAALQRAHLALAALAARDLLRRHTVRHARADLLHARFEQLGFARDELEVATERPGLEASIDPRLFECDQASSACGHLGLVLRRILLRRGEDGARRLSRGCESR